MQNQHHQHHDHERKHVHIHAQHYEKDKGASRQWLIIGAALLVVAIVYAGVLMVRAKARSAAVTALEVTPIQLDPNNDQYGVPVGDDKAPVVVREFADFQCPACGGFEPVLEQMRKEYVDTGKVRFVFFDFPLEDLHKNSVVAAQVARCARDQNHYWQMHDMLYAKQAEWGDSKDPMDHFLNYGTALGLDNGRMMGCIRTGATHQEVVRSEAYGDALGLHATPTFAVNGQAVVGGASYQDLKALIDAELAAKH
jgi:protein-disulfide isomerase